MVLVVLEGRGSPPLEDGLRVGSPRLLKSPSTVFLNYYYEALNSNVLVLAQFEDFQSKWAFKLLQRYRSTYRMFNDDVQV